MHRSTHSAAIVWALIIIGTIVIVLLQGQHHHMVQP